MKANDWKLTRIIKKSIKETLNRFSERTPEIVYNTFYGAYGLAPYNLAIWFIFKTDKDWHFAEDSGLTKEVEKVAVDIMVKNGYPASAFEVNIVEQSKSEFINESKMSEEEFQKVVARYIEMETHRKAGIYFASQEDVKNKANGNYYYYFK